MKKINILYIAHEFEVGGATKSMMELITKLTTKFNCSVVVLTPVKGKVYNFCTANNIKVIKTVHDSFLIPEGSTKLKRILKKILSPLLKIKHIFLNLVSLKIIEKNLDVNSIDIIHTNVPRDDIGGLLAKKYNICHIVHLREFSSHDYKCISLVKNSINYLDSFTTKFIAISHAIENYYISLGINKNKIECVYNGINNDIIKKYNPQNFKEKNNQLKIIFLGGITKAKGQMHALIALSKLPEKIKKNIKIDFYGVSEATYLKTIKKFVEENNLSSNINIDNYVDKVYDILNNYDVGLMCSRAEAFGRVTVEYMAAGLITIVSNRGANPEIVTDRKNGFIYDYDDINTLSDILIYINDNKNNLDDLRLAAIKKVEKEFTFEINAKNIYNIYINCNINKGD